MGSPVVAASPRKSPLSGRRINKPLVEKKRRARINGCLGQLKSLILSAVQSEQGSQVSRLEKADILEMTVKYLRHIQRHQASAVASSEPEVVAKFSAGYTECATEVIRYMDSVQCVAPEVRSRLESHLVERLRGSVPSTTAAAAATTMPGGSTTTPSFTGLPACSHMPVNDVYGRIESSTASIPEEMHRHYQTAVDLANMAAIVTAKEAVAPTPGVATTILNQPPSFHSVPRSVSELSMLTTAPPGVHMAFNMVVPTTSVVVNNLYSSHDRSHSQNMEVAPCSISPVHLSTHQIPVAIVTSSDGFYKSQTRFSQVAHSFATNISEEQNLCRNSVKNNYMDYREENRVPHPSSTDINDYFSDFQRPLHIDIPDNGSSLPPQPESTSSSPALPDSPSPPPPPATPSPPFLQPHVGYPHGTGHLPPLVSVAGSASDMTPSLLYGYTDGHSSIGHTRAEVVNIYQRQDTADTNGMGSTTNHTDNMISCSNTNRDSPHRTQAHTGRNMTPDYQDIIHNYQTQIQGHRSLPHLAPTTPSPPTLLPEGPYVSDHNQQPYPVKYQQNRLSHDSSGNYDFRASFPTVLSPNAKEQDNHQSIRYSNKARSNSQVHYSCHHHRRPASHSGDGQSDQTTPTMTESPACRTQQSPSNGPADNGPEGMKETCQSFRAPARQNDVPLSPPTLKKRLLLAQGSRGEWTASACNGLNLDNKKVHNEAGRRVLSSNHGPNPRLGHDRHEIPNLLNRDGESTPDTAFYCSTLPVGHVAGGGGEDSLWRPW